MSPPSGLLFGDIETSLATLPADAYHLIVADPPYYQVLEDESWDNQWATPEDYLAWMQRWAGQCRRVLREDGLCYIFGQPGKREHTWIHACSLLCRELAFHDLVIWDRVVGYNDRSDSFTPQYEMMLVLRKTTAATPFFNKDAVRVPYDEETIQTYLRDKRYKDLVAREEHLRKGKYATNLLRVPSLKGHNKEKRGHPSQKPIKLIEMLVRSSSPEGGWVLDPFLGSGTTAEACVRLGRKWTGIERDPVYAEMARVRVAETEQELAARPL